MNNNIFSIMFGELSALKRIPEMINRKILIISICALILAGCSALAQDAPENSPTSTQPPEIVGESRPCLPDDEGEISFVNEEHEYCLLYPAGFTVNRQEKNVVVIQGPNYSEGPEPLIGFVNIQASEPANGRSSAQVSDELVSEFQSMENIVIERVDAMLGGEPAVEIIGMPGQALSWHVVTVHNNLVYHFIFSPLGEENGQAFTDMQKLYDIVMPSFTFLD